MTGIVSTDWLAEHLDDPNLRIIDARSSFMHYEMDHIPGAQFLHIETLRMSNEGVPCKMLSTGMLGLVFSRLGISTDISVVVYTYDPADQLSASYVVWSLAVTGFTNVSILNGGLRKWTREGRLQTVRFPKIREIEYHSQFDPSIFADWRYVKASIKNREVVLVDSRTRSAYVGAEDQIPRPGHIPGAILHNYLWDFTADGTYLPLERMRERYEREGITPNKEIISYCVTGREASSVWFALQCLLGYPRVRLYQASLMEWSERPDLPMVTGTTPEGEAPAEYPEAA